MAPRVRIGDPHTNSDTSTRVSMLFSIYDALVQRDGIGMYKPGLAESWSVSPDAKTWMFKNYRLKWQTLQIILMF